MENENDCKNLEMKVRWAWSYFKSTCFKIHLKYTTIMCHFIKSIFVKFMSMSHVVKNLLSWSTISPGQEKVAYPIKHGITNQINM